LNFAIFLVYLLPATYFVILSDIFVIRHANIFWIIYMYFSTNLLNCNCKVLVPPPNKLHHQHRPKAAVSHSVSLPSCCFEPSWWHTLKQ
jgi:hypothetical protein